MPDDDAELNRLRGLLQEAAAVAGGLGYEEQTTLLARMLAALPRPAEDAETLFTTMPQLSLFGRGPQGRA